MKRKIVCVIAIASVLLTESTSKAYCNHNWVLDSNFSYPATCSYNGYEYYECSICGDCKNIDIPATGIHDWGNWEEWTKPSCKSKGKDRRVCKTCYEEEYRSVSSNPKLHDWSSWYDTKSATALNKGTAERECYVCKKVEVKTLQKLKSSVTLSERNKNIKSGKSFKLRIKSYTYGDKVKKYSSSKKSVATVNKNGRVSGKRKGKAIITVKMKSGCCAKCKVTVK